MGTKSLKICRRQAIFFSNMEHFSSGSQNKVAQIRGKMGLFIAIVPQIPDLFV